MSGETARLASFAAQLRFEDIPATVVEHAKVCLLDSLGCALYGSTLPWTRILRSTIEAIDESSTSVIWGTSSRTSAAHAALVNGSAIHAFELDDLHRRSILHAGSVVVPASLAAIEQAGDASGAAFLTAMIAGYEVGARVGMSVGTAHLLQGWHPTGTHGAPAAAAAAGSILGLSVDQMINAIGSAASQSAGLMSAQFESMVKRLHAGRAAQSGLYSALLAERGYVGIRDVFENEYGGYCTTFSPSHDLAQLARGLGAVWETEMVGFKPYSANGSCHPCIDALRDLRVEHGIGPGDIERIVFHVSSVTKEHVGWPYVPGSVTTAQMNLGYIAAVVVTDGDAFVDQFTAERVLDPALVALTRRVEIHADPKIDAQGDSHRHSMSLTVELSDGRRLETARDYARGSERAPLSREDVAEKFFKLATKAVDRRAAEHLHDLVMSFETQPSAQSLAHALAVR